MPSWCLLGTVWIEVYIQPSRKQELLFAMTLQLPRDRIYNDCSPKASPVKCLEPPTLRSRVRHSTTEPRLQWTHILLSRLVTGWNLMLVNPNGRLTAFTSVDVRLVDSIIEPFRCIDHWWDINPPILYLLYDGMWQRSGESSEWLPLSEKALQLVVFRVMIKTSRRRLPSNRTVFE